MFKLKDLSTDSELSKIMIYIGDNVKRVEYTPHVSIYMSNMLEIAKTPIEIMYKNCIYRVVPMYRDIAISEDGKIISLITRTTKAVQYEKADGYDVLITMDHVNRKMVRIGIHRLVALGWIENDDYVKYNIVDHIDKNKSNNRKDNLRWVTVSENTSLGIYDVLDKFGIYAIDVKATIKVLNSLRNVAKYLNVDHRRFSLNKLPQMVDDKYIIYDIEKTVDPLKQYNESKYKYSIYHNSKLIKYFNNTKELITLYNDISNIKTNDVVLAKTELGKLGYVINEHNSDTSDKYDVLNIDTNKEYENLTREQVTRLLTSLNIDKKLITTRLNKKYRYGVPIGDFVIKFSNDTEYMTRKKIEKFNWELTDIITGEVKVYNSLRKAASVVGVDRKLIKSNCNTNYPYRGYVIKKMHTD